MNSAFIARVRGAFGEAGLTWLRALPEHIEQAAERWSLAIGPPLTPLSYNYVAPATRADDSRAILKLGVPQGEFTSEIAALRHYDGVGACLLLEAEPGAMLLEELGYPLVHVPDDEAATEIAIEVMQRLHATPAPAEHPFRDVASWGRALWSVDEQIPAHWLDRARRLHSELVQSSSEEAMVLHADLHHYNILKDGEDWRAIDPKGIVGEPAYEAGALLRNPIGLWDVPDLRRVTARRLDQLGAAFDRARVVGWATAQAVLSACWTVEEGGSVWSRMLTLADVLWRLR